MGLHYGQSVFEGQKVFHCKDGKVRIFNDKENHARLSSGCERLMLPQMRLELFQEAIDIVVRENIEYVPPYGSGCSMYVRPVLFGSSDQIALHPATEAQFLVMAAPVSGYFKGGGLSSVPAFIVEDFDRAAPKGVGGCKVAGNYAADMKAAHDGKEKGYPIGLYLDAQHRRYVEEFNSSNFVAIVGKRYVTPTSASILPSVTNKCLAQLAEDIGLTVERRPIDFLAEVCTFDEVGAVGTAVVVTPVRSITKGDKTWNFKEPETLTRLYDLFKRIQVGDEEDKRAWLREITI